MEDIILGAIQHWISQNPVWAARLVGATLVLIVLGNFCKAIEKAIPPETLNKNKRLKTGLRIGQTVGNVMLGLVVLIKHFISGQDPDELIEHKTDPSDVEPKA